MSWKGIKIYVKVSAFAFQWYVRDVAASILYDLARWIAP